MDVTSSDNYITTHDGKPKPRREDVMQVVKRWWSGGRQGGCEVVEL